MKTRSGFVSNSSSSSFAIRLSDLSPQQIEDIHNHLELARTSYKTYDLGSTQDEAMWSIVETDRVISGNTYMDNFDMHEFLILIGVHSSLITWEE
jgi:hypothetical protein